MRKANDPTGKRRPRHPEEVPAPDGLVPAPINDEQSPAFKLAKLEAEKSRLSAKLDALEAEARDLRASATNSRMQWHRAGDEIARLRALVTLSSGSTDMSAQHGLSLLLDSVVRNLSGARESGLGLVMGVTAEARHNQGARA